MRHQFTFTLVLLLLFSGIACEQWWTEIRFADDELPAGTVAEYYEYELAFFTDSSSEYEVFLSAGDLPPGLSVLDRGVIVGTPLVAGTYTFELTVNQEIQNSENWQGDDRDDASDTHHTTSTNTDFREFEIVILPAPDDFSAAATTD